MKAKMLNVVNGVSLALLGGISAINPSPVYAFDTKNYPGIMCVKSSGSGGTVANQWGGGISNNNWRNSLDIYCPVIKDVMRRGIQGGKIRVWDTHYKQDIVCQLFSHRFEDGGQVVAMTPAMKTSGSNTLQDLTELRFRPPAPQAHTNRNSHYWFNCKLPPTYNGLASYVSSYSVTEFGESD